MMTYRRAPFAILASLFLPLSACAASIPAIRKLEERPHVQANADLTVQVINLPSGLGTGVVVDRRGYVLTNHHLVEKHVNPVTGEVMTTGTMGICVGKAPARTCISAEVVADDPKHDLALLKVAKTFAGEVRLGDDLGLVSGADVYLIGNIGSILEPSSLFGRYIGTATEAYADPKQFDVKLPLLVLDINLSPGSSGGPVFDENGLLIGLGESYTSPAFGGRSLGIAVPAGTIRAFLKKHLPK